jgi:hypothetical protein
MARRRVFRPFFLLSIVAFIFLLPAKSLAQTPAADTLKKKHYFELSFGQSLLFISKGQAASVRNN